jgi:hypothetical protein
MPASNASLTLRLGFRVSISARSLTGLRMSWRCGCLAEGLQRDALEYRACAEHERRASERTGPWPPPDTSTKG